MSTEAAGAAREATIDAALRGLRDTLAADGYLLEWFMEQHNHVAIRVVASSEACADCLVPPELMRSILVGRARRYAVPRRQHHPSAEVVSHPQAEQSGPRCA